MKVLRKIIEIDEEKCDGCGQCVPSCAEGALQIVDGKARMVADIYCDGLGACLGDCPNDALQIIEREADEFDESAVEEHLAKTAREPAPTLECGCPSSMVKQFAPMESCPAGTALDATADIPTALTHWPVQIRLVPPEAQFLKGANLLVAADCVPFAYAGFHRDLLKGKALLVGCPKLDDAEEYIQKFAQIFKAADLESVTAAVMEVPCCSAMPVIMQKGMEAAGKNIHIKQVVISTRGKILEN